MYHGITFLAGPLSTRTHRKQIHYLNGVLAATGEMLSFVCTTDYSGKVVLELREFERVKANVEKGN